MKGKKFYIALIGLFIIGIGSVVIYRQQREAQVLEFEGYEITSIESRVDDLYNDDKTDIQENIAPELANLEPIFLELNEKNLSQRSKRRVQDLETAFLNAKEMYELQEDILDLFREEDIVRKNASTDDIEELQALLVPFEDRTVYYSRNYDLLTDARVQIETIEKATELVEQLMEEGQLNEDIDEAELEELEELVKQIKDESIQERLLQQIESTRLALDAMEEVALDEPEDLEEEEEEEDTEEVVEEEDLEEESEEAVQETPQRIERPSTSTTQNNNRSNSSQTNRQPSNTSNNSSDSSSGSSSNQSSDKQSDNQSSGQNDSDSNTTEQRPAVTDRYQETKVVEVIPFETFVYENATIPAGEEIVYEEGRPGRVTETYEVIIYTNGTSNRKFISRDRTEPVDRVVTVGTKEE